ncbi:MAG: AMP-binding protein [Georgfuchsia sp.]
MLTFPHFDPHFPRDMWVLPRILESQSVRFADRPFLSWTDENKPLSFSQVNAQVNSLAHGFAAEGVTKGDKVVLYMSNCLEFVLTWFALTKLGAAEVPVGDIQKGVFLQHQLNVSQAKYIVTTRELMAQIAEVEADVPLLETCYLLGDENTSSPFKRIKVKPYSSLYSGNTENPGIAVAPSDTAAILYTSGTTSWSKGVVMSHSQMYFFAEEDVQLVRLTSEDVYMTGFPLFHGNAQFLTVYPCLIAGAHCVLYPRFSASDFIGRARRSGATVTNLLGAVMSFICDAPPQPDDREHKLRRIYAAPLAFDLAKTFTDRFGPMEFVDGFGQTEISLVFMTPPGANRPEGASGVLVDQFFEIKLVDPDTDEDVPVGEGGELLVRNKQPYIMCSEYLGMPEKTVETWRNLWFHTGDVLRRDNEGWYYFIDRVSDSLRRRGENVSSFEVELVVRSHPAILECAVIGVKADEQGGEDEVKACVIVNDGMELDFADLIEWCDQRMGAHMVPRYIEIYKSLPKTPSEKIKKNELRKLGVTANTWDRQRAGVKLAKTRIEGKAVM